MQLAFRTLQQQPGSMAPVQPCTDLFTQRKSLHGVHMTATLASVMLVWFLASSRPPVRFLLRNLFDSSEPHVHGRQLLIFVIFIQHAGSRTHGSRFRWRWCCITGLFAEYSALPRQLIRQICDAAYILLWRPCHIARWHVTGMWMTARLTFLQRHHNPVCSIRFYLPTKHHWPHSIWSITLLTIDF